MQKPEENKQWFFSVAFLVTAIAVHFLLGVNWLVRVIGVACVFTGLYWVFIQRIPVGWEGRAPSFHLTGTVAIVTGVIMGLIGLLMIFFAPIAACLVGWSASSSMLASFGIGNLASQTRSLTHGSSGLAPFGCAGPSFHSGPGAAK